MTRTATSISNMALDILREAVISDIAAVNPVAKWFNRNYEETRDALLREYPWKFALKRASITVDGTAPTFDWLYRYAIPADCLRALPLTYDGTFEGFPIPHQIEAGYILTNEPTPIKLRYIYKVTDPTLFDPLFAEALAGKLAVKGAHWHTGKLNVVEIASSLYRDAIFRAKQANAIEASPERPFADDVIAARYA